MAFNTIQLKGTFRLEELRAVAALTPGHLVEVTSAGKVQKHSTAAGVGVPAPAEAAFAAEDALQGRTIDIAYGVDEVVQVHFQNKGSVVYAWIKDGQVIVKGDKLVSNGDGTLKKLVNITDLIVCVADEALSPVGSDGRIAARVF